MSGRFDIEVSWEDAPGVTSPEIEATWARMVMKVGEGVVTLVAGADGTPRSGLYVSAYPLAEWIAFNWWSLTNEVQVSSVPSVEWTWSFASPGSWLQRHNVRAAGGGMQWPDLTIVPEGAVTGVAWSKSGARAGGRGLRFLTSDYVTLQSDVVLEALARFVEAVIERLREKSVRGTPLESEWRALSALDADERAFAASAGRLGLDPFSQEDLAADEIESVFRDYGRDLADEILDASGSSLDGLREISRWLREASGASPSLYSTDYPAKLELVLREPDGLSETAIDPYRPWNAGYATARNVRGALLDGSAPDDGDVATMVDHLAAVQLRGRAGELQGFTLRERNRALLMIPEREYGVTSTQERFLKARSLGSHLLKRDRSRFVLTSTRTPLQQAARAFAAELLAPADVIRDMLEKLGGHADFSAFDAIGEHLGVSPRVIEHQYDNQISRAWRAGLDL